MNFALTTVLLVAGCAWNAASSPDALSHTALQGSCAAGPVVQRSGFHHARSRIVARLGQPRHRGTDLLAVEGDEKQTIAGKLAYGSLDKDLEDEDVSLFACAAGRWNPLGAARTNDEGRFEIALRGARRLPAGMHELFAAVLGDGSGVRFLAYIARVGEQVIVTDVDGTITESEYAVVAGLVLDKDIRHPPDAPEALSKSGYAIVYLTARGDQLTDVTRRWLDAHGFPPGVIRMAPSPGVVRGASSHKERVLRSLPVPIAAAIGNKPSDVAAYSRANIPAPRIFIKLPEYEGALRSDLDARRAVGFTDYSLLPSLLPRSP